MYFLLSTINAYLPLLQEDLPCVYELRDIIVISHTWSFYGACAPHITDDTRNVFV